MSTETIKPFPGALSLGFPGGIHPMDDGKAMSRDNPVQSAPLFSRYEVIVNQNVGAPPSVIVKKGDLVKKGDKIAEAGGFVSAPLHAPTSGVVAGITELIGSTGSKVQAVAIDADGLDEWGVLPEKLDYLSADPAVLKQRIADAGIVGMGGAAFPSHVKLSPPPDKTIDYLILNGAECEPFLTADYRLMLESPERVLAGAAIMGKALQVEQIIIGVEANKMEALEALAEKAADYGVKLMILPERYPQGSEKQLIYAVTRRKVPAGGLPMDAGCVVQNVGSAAATADAVLDGKPLIERITTITGTPVQNPGNWLVRIGTPVLKLMELAGGVKTEPGKVILGGPMMGFAQKALEVTVMKNTSGVLLLAPNEVEQYDSTACIRCGACVQACPMRLSPGVISTAVESEKFDLAAAGFVMDCLECGACAYVCPAHRPLVQHFRRAKAEIRNRMKRGK